MIVLGYIFTAINYICYCIGRFSYSKQHMLLYDLIAKVFTVMGLYCLGSLSGAYSFCVTFVLLIVVNLKEYHKKNWRFGYIMFQFLYISILFYTFRGISSILVFTTSSIKLFSVWWLPPQKIRLLSGINSTLFLAYQLSIKNWVGLCEIIVMISNYIAYFKYRRNNK